MISIKSRIINIYNQHRPALFFFVSEILYQFIVTNKFELWQADDVTYTYHVVDFGMGFCTKILPGAIYSAIFHKYSVALVSLWETILFLMFLVIISVLLERLYLSFNNNDYIKLFIFFALTGPCTLSIFIIEFGMLDVYWFYFAIIAICLIFSKKLVPFTIPLAFLIVLVHYSSLLCYIPLIVLLMLYKSATSNDKSEKKILVVTASIFAITALSSSAYFMLFDTSNLKLSMDEFNNALNSRGSDYYLYYDFAFYRTDSSNDGLDIAQVINNDNTALGNLLGILIQQIKVTISLIKPHADIAGIILLIPIIVIIMSFFVSKIKNKNTNLSNKIVLLLMILMFPISFSGGCMFSTDLLRWYSHAFICLLISFLFVLYCNGKSSTDEHSFLINILSKIPKPAIIAYCFVYSLMTFEIYN